jgi:MoxR-like ATPase
VAQAEEVAQAAKLCTECKVSADVMRYMAKLCQAARDPDKVRLGPSPRALLALMRCCQALAAIRGRDYVIPDDVKELAGPVLAHRIVLRGINYQMTNEVFIQDILKQVAVPTETRK